MGGQSAGRDRQLELAAKAGDSDFYQISVVESRLRKLRAEMAELQRNGFGRSGDA